MHSVFSISREHRNFSRECKNMCYIKTQQDNKKKHTKTRR